MMKILFLQTLSCVIVVLLLGSSPSQGFIPPERRSFANHQFSFRLRKSEQHPYSSTELSLHPAEIAALVVAGVAGWLYIDGTDDRARQNVRAQEEAIYNAYQEERARQAYIEPKEYWTEQELAQYNGVADEDGPILMAADGLVFNVYKGRNFYGPGGEYHMFAGRDATRFLAKTITQEETEEESQQPLTMGERAALAGWMFTLNNKYEVVGKLEGFDPSTTSMKEGVKSAWKDPRV